MKKVTAKIVATGSYVPDYVLTNNELESLVETSDEWITSRTGIKERRILKDPDKASSYLGIQACKKLLEKSNIDPKEIDLVIVGTATPDLCIGNTSSYIAYKIGATNAFAFDLSAACSGFLYGISSAASFIESGRYKKVLLIGADKMSSIVDYEDRTTCILFGDAGAAVLFDVDNTGTSGFMDEYLRSDGSGRDHLYMEAGGSLLPPSHETIDKKQHYLKQDGRYVFKFAVSNMIDSCQKLLEKNKITKDDIDWVLPHQANKRIIDAIVRGLEVPDEKVLKNIHKYGNTTCATIPLLIDEFHENFKKGDKIIFLAFGGGFTWGASYMIW